jgi:putative membrane protein
MGHVDHDSETEPDYRFTLANERTFLAWQRTALALLAASVAAIQFVSEAALPGARYLLGLTLVVLATLTAALGLWRWRQVDRAMRQGTTLPRHPTPAYLAVGLAVIGLLVIGAVLIRAMSR